MSESNCTVVRIVLLNQDMTVEASHFRNGEYADSAEGTGCHRQNLALCDVCAQLGIRCALQTVEGNVPGDDISFQSTLGNFFRQASCHDELIFHLAEGKLAGCGISAVEAHEGIFLGIVIFSFDVGFKHISGNRIVDIQQSNHIVADNGSDELTQSAVNINFTGYRDASLGQTAVYIAGNAAKLCLECRPAFSGNCYEFTASLMFFDPVKQGQLVLSQLV